MLVIGRFIGSLSAQPVIELHILIEGAQRLVFHLNLDATNVLSVNSRQQLGLATDDD